MAEATRRPRDKDLVTVRVTYCRNLSEVGTIKQLPRGEARTLAEEGRVQILGNVLPDPDGEQPAARTQQAGDEQDAEAVRVSASAGQEPTETDVAVSAARRRARS